MESDRDVSPLIQMTVSVGLITATGRSHPRGTAVWAFRAEPVSTVTPSSYLTLNELKVSTIKNSVPQSRRAHLKGPRARRGSRPPDRTAQVWSTSFTTGSPVGHSCFRAWILDRLPMLAPTLPCMNDPVPSVPLASSLNKENQKTLLTGLL